MLRKRLQSDLIKEILRKFPETEAIIIYGAAIRKDFSPGINDVDLLIVSAAPGSRKSVQKKLKVLCGGFHGEVELDPALCPADDFKRGKKNLRMITWHSDRRAHGFDLFRIKRGWVVYGDLHILETFPSVSLQEALEDVLPHVRKVFVRDLRKKLEKSRVVAGFVRKEADYFYVIARSIYTIDTGKIGPKKDALAYVGRKYHETADVTNMLISIYMKKRDAGEISKARVRVFLDLADTKISAFLSPSARKSRRG